MFATGYCSQFGTAGKLKLSKGKQVGQAFNKHSLYRYSLTVYFHLSLYVINSANLVALLLLKRRMEKKIYSLFLFALAQFSGCQIVKMLSLFQNIPFTNLPI